jgi:hypothetical protein
MSKNLHVLIVITILIPVAFVFYSIFTFQELKIEEDKFEVGGFFGYEIPIEQIDTIMLLDVMPNLWASGGLEYGEVKKGNFVRGSDQKRVQVAVHHEDLYIKMVTKDFQIYFYNAERIRDTKMLYDKLQKIISNE